jgi:tRNASer (uridine44-2'-O)-methyltransferase
MGFQPDNFLPDASPVLKDTSGEEAWTPLYQHSCSFPPETFSEVMMNLIRNPNINSNHLFRADILLEVPFTDGFIHDPLAPPRLLQFRDFSLKTILIRKLIPRNALVDKPMDQTCLLYNGSSDTETKSLVIYLPHISSPEEAPFYHPGVRGIAFLHTFKKQDSSALDKSFNLLQVSLSGNLEQPICSAIISDAKASPQMQKGIVSIHYSFFESAPQTPLLDRTAQHLLATLHKHGQGSAAGYVKRVHHDNILPQAKVQDTYAKLKTKYARIVIKNWVEATDPAKHVFEDLGIAAFLIELWAEMFPEPDTFPGFVDIGCGNGLLVHILIEEGYAGWGFDARRRKSWETYSAKAQKNLKELVLVPSIIQQSQKGESDSEATTTSGTHDGRFQKGTFIISNHADELTPWTPILGNLSESPFLMIPCCSHNLTGARFRAPPSKGKGVSNSAYASLVTWVSKVAEECGWDIEKEMLRIPSTRNTGLLGRRRNTEYADVDLSRVVDRYGGAAGWEENAMKLVKVGPRGH